MRGVIFNICAIFGDFGGQLRIFKCADLQGSVTIYIDIYAQQSSIIFEIFQNGIYAHFGPQK